MMITMQHVIEVVLEGDELLFLERYTPGHVRYREAELLKILGLRYHLRQLRSKVDHKLAIVREV